MEDPLAVDERGNGSQVVAAPGFLDLHDIGSEVRQLLGRERTRIKARDVEHPDSR